MVPGVVLYDAIPQVVFQNQARWQVLIPSDHPCIGPPYMARDFLDRTRPSLGDELGRRRTTRSANTKDLTSEHLPSYLSFRRCHARISVSYLAERRHQSSQKKIWSM